jgi:uncharacterized protein (UPF0276 family)
MKLAVNYSPQAAELLRTGQIEFDLFKVPNWPSMIADASAILPVYVHFDLRVGDGQIASIDWNEIQSFLEETHTSMVNLHVWTPPDLDPCDQIQVENILNRIVSEVELVTKRFGHERVITENIPLPEHGKKYMRPVATPAFFHRLTAETGCGMLLDLAHAAITAQSLKTDPYVFFSEFPIRRLKEIHITGLGMHDGEIHDHLEMQDRDWQHFEWVIGKIRQGDWHTPEIIAFEYGGIGDPFLWRSESLVLLTQVPRLYKLIHNGNGKNPSG